MTMLAFLHDNPWPVFHVDFEWPIRKRGAGKRNLIANQESVYDIHFSN